MIQKLLNAAMMGGLLLVASSGLASGQTVISIAGEWNYSRNGTFTVDIDGSASTTPDNGNGTLTISQSGASIGWNYPACGWPCPLTGTIQGKRIHVTGPFYGNSSINFSQNTYTAQGVLSDDTNTITLAGSGLAVGTSEGVWGGTWHWTMTGTDTTVLTRRNPYLSLLIAPIPENGRITGPGISCGTGGTGDCAESVASGTTVTLTAEPATGYQVGAWSGCPNPIGATCSVPMTQTRSVSIRFTPVVLPTLVWQNLSTGDAYVWTMDGVTQIGGDSLGGVSDLNWRLVGVADLTGDGQPDLLWQHAGSGDVYLWTMNGTTPTGGAYVAHGMGPWTIVATGDLCGGDGKPDLVWQHETTGDVYCWCMNGTDVTSGTYLAQGMGLWKVVAAADLTGDGKPDLLWQHETSGDVYLWTMDGTTLTGGTYLAQGMGLWKIVATADLNADEKPDLLWQDETSGDVYVWFMNGQDQTGGAYVARDMRPWKVVGPK